MVQGDPDAQALPEPGALHAAKTPKSRHWPGRALFVIICVLDILLVVGALFVRRPTPLAPVLVAAGSEDLAFFSDPAVQAEFARHGLNVQVRGFGGGALASSVNLKEYDAIFPSSAVIAAEVQDKLGRQVNDVTEIVPFGTPLVVFTWDKLIPLLHTLKIVNQNGLFDVSQYLAIASAGTTTWNSISGNNFYPNPNQVLLKMADPRYANSGAMFVAIASFALNHDRVVSQQAQVQPIATMIAQAIAGLGQLPPATDQVFTDYLTYRMNGVPMALGYESEFIGQELTVGLPPGAVMIHLDRSVDCDHTILPRTVPGNTFAVLMRTDATLQDLEEKYGFRVTGRDFSRDMARYRITLPPDFAINTPNEANLEALVDAIEPPPPK